MLLGVLLHPYNLHEVSKPILPASVAHLDARLTGNQEVVGAIPSGSATFFYGD